MFDLNKLLLDKGVDQKDFCEMTGISKKRFDNLLAQKSVLSLPEIERVSAFLGVSVPEFFNGVYVRKGELEEVAKTNNENRFSYFLKSATKKYDKYLKIGERIGNIFIILLIFIYLATVVFSLIDVVFVPVVAILAIFLPVTLSWEGMRVGKKLIGKNIPAKQSHINYVSASFVIAFLLIGITTFIMDIITIPVLVLLLACAALVAVPMVLPKIKIKDVVKEACGCASIGLSVVLSFTSFALINIGTKDKINFENPYEMFFSKELTELLEKSVLSSALFAISFTLIIFFVLYKKYLFVTKAYNYFAPMTEKVEENKANVAKKLIAALLSATLSCAIMFMCEGVFYKVLYSTAFEENELNWTAEYIDDFSSSFSDGEFDTIENNGATIQIPKGYILEEDENDIHRYKNDKDEYILFSFDDSITDSFTVDLYKMIAEDGDVEIPEGFLQEKRKEYEKHLGIYPETFYEWEKLYSTYTLDDVSIFNGPRSRLLLSVFVMKSVVGMSQSEHYLYERDDVCASVTTIHSLTNDRFTYFVRFDTLDSASGKYTVSITTTSDNSEDAYETTVKILNSITIEG